MKTVTYNCDYNHCSNETNNIEKNNWVEIGSDNGSLGIKNYFEKRRIIKMGRHSDIHFCSIECLTSFFIHKDDQAVP